MLATPRATCRGNRRFPKPTLRLASAGFQVVVWFGMLAPAGTPPAILAKLNNVIRSAVSSPTTQAALNKLGVEPQSSSPKEFAATIRADIDKWAKVVNEANIRLD